MQQFAIDLLSTGRVRLKSDAEPTPEESAAAIVALGRLESEYRAELPGSPPDMNSAAAEWALASVYRLCQFHVYRQLGPDDMASRFHDAAPGSNMAAVHYSVDVVLRFLPDIERLIRSSSPEDPLLEIVGRLASDWPLSSVGMADVEVDEARLEPVLQDDCLRRMYVDRVIAGRDTSRTEHPIVQDGIRQVAGSYPELTAGLVSENDRDHEQLE